MEDLNALTRQFESSAHRLRMIVSRIFGLNDPTRIVLTPGILVALQLVILEGRVKRILVADDEYYDRSHFGVRHVSSATFDELVDASDAVRPDMVLASHVTWLGRVNRLTSVFRRIRQKHPKALLVADCAHSLATAPCRLDRFGADIVCGDTGKWLLKLEGQSAVAFLWCGSPAARAVARAAFCRYFLALSGEQHGRKARFAPPREVLNVERQLSKLSVTSASLRARYEANRRVADETRMILGQPPAAANIIWVPTSPSREIRRPGVTRWDLAAGGTRFICRHF